MTAPKNDKTDPMSIFILVCGLGIVAFIIVMLTINVGSKDRFSAAQRGSSVPVPSPPATADPATIPSQAKSAPAPTAKACNDRLGAYVMAQDFVSSKLKAPATAEFPAMASGEAVVTPLDGCRFRVTSYVDSQNGFGANIRTKFSATLKAPKVGDSWSLETLLIGQ